MHMIGGTVLVIGMLAGCAQQLPAATESASGPGPSAPASVAGHHMLKYEVFSRDGGVTSARIQWDARSGAREEQVQLPLTDGSGAVGLELDDDAIPSVPLISAQAVGWDIAGMISCRISLDGQVIAEMDAWGERSSVTCRGHG